VLFLLHRLFSGFKPLTDSEKKEAETVNFARSFSSFNSVQMSPKDKKSLKGTKDVDVEAKINEIIIDGAPSGAGVKMEVDYSETTDEKVPKAKAMAEKEGKLDEAIEMLVTLEKQTRTGCDMHSTAKILVAIVQMCYEVGTFSHLLTQLALAHVTWFL
jgi:hypothetical protein